MKIEGIWLFKYRTIVRSFIFFVALAAIAISQKNEWDCKKRSFIQNFNQFKCSPSLWFFSLVKVCSYFHRSLNCLWIWKLKNYSYFSNRFFKSSKQRFLEYWKHFPTLNSWDSLSIQFIFWVKVLMNTIYLGACTWFY